MLKFSMFQKLGVVWNGQNLGCLGAQGQLAEQTREVGLEQPCMLGTKV